MIKTWAFIISQPLAETELSQLVHDVKTFAESWTAHEHALASSVDLIKNRILVIQVDESVTGASGCSIDKLTRFLKLCELRFGIELMNRMRIAYVKDNQVAVIDSRDVKEALLKGELNENTLIYNTAISNQEEYANWLQPLKNTWLTKYLTNKV